MLLDISERGRYLGLVLFSAQQFKSQVHKRVVGNAGTAIYTNTFQSAPRARARGDHPSGGYGPRNSSFNPRPALARGATGLFELPE